jgi:hypothetical protein
LQRKKKTLLTGVGGHLLNFARMTYVFTGMMAFPGDSRRVESTNTCREKFFLFLALFLGAYFVVCLSLCKSFHQDEADQILFSQRLALGYHEQPPLYSWLTWAFFRILGSNLVTLAFLKTLILGLIYCGLYHCARLMLEDTGGAKYAAFSPFLMFSFAWHSISYLTHTNLMCAVFIGTLYIFLRLLRSGGCGTFALLGLLLGLGTLSKYNYLLFAGALFVAGLLTPPLRKRLLNRRLLLTLGIALLVVFPHSLFLVGHLDQLEGIRNKVCPNNPCFGQFAVGGASLIITALLSVTSLLFCCLLFFPQETRTAGNAESPQAATCRFLERYFLAAAVLLLLLAAAGAVFWSDRWLYPLVLPAPLYFFGRFWRREIPLPRRRGFGYLLAGCGLILIVVRAGQLALGGSSSCPYYLSSFAQAAERLETSEAGTIVVTPHRDIAGNLCYWSPRLSVVCADRSLYRAGIKQARGPFLLIWDTVEGENPPPGLRSYLLKEFHQEIKPDEPVCYVWATARGNIPRRLGYVIVAPETAATAALEFRR